MKKLMLAIAGAVAVTSAAFAEGEWFEPSISTYAAWPTTNALDKGLWSNFSSASLVDGTAGKELEVAATAEAPLTFTARSGDTWETIESRDLDTFAINFSSTIEFVPFATEDDIPEPTADMKGGVACVKDGYFYVLCANADEEATQNEWVLTDIATVKDAIDVKVRAYMESAGVYKIAYKIGDNDEIVKPYYAGAGTTLKGVSYIGDGVVSALKATTDGIMVDYTVPGCANADIEVWTNGTLMATAAGEYQVEAGGALKVVYTGKDGYVFYGYGSQYVAEGNHTLVINQDTLDSIKLAPVKLDGEYYYYLSDALEAINKENMTLTICKDDLKDEGCILEFGSSITNLTLDLGGKNVEVTQGIEAYCKGLVITNGTLTGVAGSIGEQSYYSTGLKLVDDDGKRASDVTIAYGAKIIGEWGMQINGPISNVVINGTIETNGEGADAFAINYDEESDPLPPQLCTITFGTNCVINGAVNIPTVAGGTPTVTVLEGTFTGAFVADGCTIYGGKFDSENNTEKSIDAMVADGLEAKKKGEWIVVQEKGAEPTKTPFAIIIVDGETTTTNYYETFALACEAVTAGGTITIMEDVSEALVTSGTVDFTLDINGKTITSDATATIRHNGSGVLTLVDSDGAGAVKNSADAMDMGIAVWARCGSIVITSGYYENASTYEATLYVGAATANGKTITVNGGTFKNTAASYRWRTDWNHGININVWNSLTNKDTAFVINGGSFSTSPAAGDDSNVPPTFLASTKAASWNGSTSYYDVVDAVANIGSVGYATLQEAFDAVGEDAATIKLLADTAESSITLSAGKTVTLDLNGKKITSNSWGLRNFGTLTVDNGTIESVEGAINIYGNSVTTINGGTYTTTDNCVVMGNGNSDQGNATLTINGGTFNGGITTAGYIACGVYVPNSGTYAIKGGTFNITGGCGVCARAGTTKIDSAVEFNVTGTGTGWVGDKKAQVPAGVIAYFDWTIPPYPGYQAGDTIKSQTKYDTAEGQIWSAEAEEGYYSLREVVPATGVTLNKSAIELAPEATETLTATVAPENADVETTVWASDDEAVATVADGVVTAVAAGTANITVTITDYSGYEFSATCVVTVKAAGGDQPTPASGSETKVEPVAGEENTYKVEPTGDKTTVAVDNVKEGDTLVVGATVTEIGVNGGESAGATIKVMNSDNSAEVPNSAMKGWDGNTFDTALDGEATVQVATSEGTVEVPVEPTLIEETTTEKPLVVGDAVTTTVQAIPGLTYKLVRDTDLGGTFEDVAASAKGESGTATITLTDGNKPEGKAFYKIVVTK